MEMTTYYSTFPSGFESVVSGALPGLLPGVRVVSGLDGAILYSAGCAPSRLAALRLFLNSFVVLAVFRNLPEVKPLEAMMREVAGGRIGGLERRSSGFGGPFRLVTSDRNRLTHVSPAVLGAAERRISSVVGGRPCRSGARREYWFLRRSEGMGLFLQRITERRGTHATLHPGELQPEVSHLLCLMSDPAAEDAFLDPFCGWGSVLAERVSAFPYRSACGFDTDPARVEAVRRRLEATRSRRVTVRRADARELPGVADRSVDAVVTDPPWGQYQSAGPAELLDLYTRFLRRLAEVLTPDGAVVLLLGRGTAAEQAIAGSAFHVERRCEILLSGRKASAVLLSARA